VGALVALRVLSNVFTARSGIVCVSLLGLAGCQPTQLSLRVRTPGESQLNDTLVTLVIRDEPVCTGGILFFGRTDRDGLLSVHTPACGRARLVVARPGRRTVTRRLDTCETKSLEVVLWPAPPPRAPEAPCGKVVHDFLLAWLRQDDETARSLWVHPNDYMPHRLQPTSEKPLATDVAESQLEDGVCGVRVTEFYASGCELARELQLEQRGGNWRIRWMEDVVPEP
jgi:hypothetical protein